MSNRKLIIFATILAVLLCIGTASAADVDANDTEIASANDNEIVNMENDLDALSVDEGTYSDLRDEINAGGNIINLTKKDYSYVAGDGDTIEIENSCIINGNGAIIDMVGSNIRTFYINASEVTIKNLTIKNANFDGWGGAVYFNGNGTVTNCNFTNNTASNSGGAIYFLNNGDVTNCNFANNKATGDYSYGGAIWFTSEGIVKNCNFASNSAKYGGAVYFNGNGTVTNCNFANNKATDDNAYGGAILIKSGNVINCNFTNNTAHSGGAVYSNDNCAVTNCYFADNHASYSAGAIYFNSGGTITNCDFVNNSAVAQGGAVNMYSAKVINCKFINNSVPYYEGGAIYITDGDVRNCSFISNFAAWGGGAIYVVNYCNIRNCSFISNYHSAVMFISDEQPIQLYSGRVEYCTFINNSARLTGGAIDYYGIGHVNNCSFINNSATNHGGAINMHSGVVGDCDFINNSAGINGGAIEFYGSEYEYYYPYPNDFPNWVGTIIYEFSVTNCIFDNNTASECGGAIFFSRAGGKIVGSNFTCNSAGTGSAIHFDSSSASKYISDSILLNNMADVVDKSPLNATQIENTIEITLAGQNNLLNAIYSRSDVNVINVTYWGANGVENTGSSYVTPTRSQNESGQNITIIGFVNGSRLNATKVTDSNGKIVLEEIGGNYYIVARHYADSYYAWAETILTNGYVNVTEITTTNKTVNITAKSNIGNDSVSDRLMFILPNCTEIVANYNADGTWWALHEFDAYGKYNVTASFAGLDGVIINNANITINKMDSSLTIEDIVFDYGATGSSSLSFTGATGVNASVVNQLNANINVAGDRITVSGLNGGTYTLRVTTIADSNHNPVTKTSTITVNKLKTQLTASALTTTYHADKNLVITLKDSKGNPLDGVKVSVDLNGAKQYPTDKNGQIKVSTKGLLPKNYVAKITFNDNKNYIKSTKNVKITVKKATPKITAAKKTFKKSVKTKKYAVTLKANKNAIKNAKITLKVNKKTYTAKTNSKGQATFKITNLKNKGTFTAIVKYAGSKYYTAATVKAKITVK